MSTTRAGGGGRYEIVVGKRLGARSATAFEGFELSDVPDDGTLLRSGVMDQAALHGVLGRIRDLGIPLVSVRLLTEDGPVALPVDSLPVDSRSVGRSGVAGSGGNSSGEAE